MFNLESIDRKRKERRKGMRERGREGDMKPGRKEKNKAYNRCFPDHQLRNNTRILLFIHFSTIAWYLSPAKYSCSESKQGNHSRNVPPCLHILSFLGHYDVAHKWLCLASWSIHGPHGNIPGQLQESVSILKHLPLLLLWLHLCPADSPAFSDHSPSVSFGRSKTKKKTVPNFVTSRNRLVLPPPFGATCSMAVHSEEQWQFTFGSLAAPSPLPVHPREALCPESPLRSHSFCSWLGQGVFSQVPSALWQIPGPVSQPLILPSASVIPRWLAPSVCPSSPTFLILTSRFSFYLELRGDAPNGKKS